MPADAGSSLKIFEVLLAAERASAYPPHHPLTTFIRDRETSKVLTGWLARLTERIDRLSADA
ncbi:MAG: hypothetical protein HY870_01435 [Chloroflexi bacterium]|nr:hypothetical protein [Chloroflexota bacterium]